MALQESTLQGLIVVELEAQGFVTTGPHAWAGKMATAIANAVVAHIKNAAEVPVTAGSSVGVYQVI